ncbi:hypothetical protein RFI_27914, partial [Reticulomyxa filosa]
MTTPEPKDYESKILWRTVIFIRHGESVWNESTDQGLRAPLQAAMAMGQGLREYATLKWRTNEYKHEDSLFVDAPLSAKGMKQANELSETLKKHASIRERQKTFFLRQHQQVLNCRTQTAFWHSITATHMYIYARTKKTNKHFIMSPNQKTHTNTAITIRKKKGVKHLFYLRKKKKKKKTDKAEMEEKLKTSEKKKTWTENELNNTDKSSEDGDEAPPLYTSAMEHLEEAVLRMEIIMTNALPLDPFDCMVYNHQLLQQQTKNESADLFIRNDMPLDRNYVFDILNGFNVPSIVASSNLRRAISSCVVALWSRLKMSNEK